MILENRWGKGSIQECHAVLRARVMQFDLKIQPENGLRELTKGSVA
ncbi:hypothetical protein QO034_00565 [Sedimentitalea sp. JM2-8]|uniref:Transposase n=1 Tax=Sedimentitalea xiamensis TaxID=3050037 RepID=A0ABT7F8Z6_9RHOB|nr:hypothetical protein [Sedimentitalea xiamensis]MDK3071588.1 hypothetical protein [Sedimentitalea xiamensis]